ncbi:uncharacterized protein LOC120077270 [Benincasa hispida]|uniref:uncharacterized protein LOC120077270 n=1 Tax=Benincasa hispida TaxID=102211 RepID=UPI001901F5AE|nr:uncharacterized protein LOC120077270 [Benincasa hispida]
MKEVVKKEIIKWLDADIIYPIADSTWVSPVQCVPKKGKMTVVPNANNELIPMRAITSWRICMDYRKLNVAIKKDHFPLPFIDQMLDRLVGNDYFCFLDGSTIESLLEADRPFDFDPHYLTAFKALKDALTTVPILIATDWAKPFELLCDASGYVMEAVLAQKVKTMLHPIAYASRTLNSTQENYTTAEKELLAIIDQKGIENQITDHLSRLENLEVDCIQSEVNASFPDEQLLKIEELP